MNEALRMKHENINGPVATDRPDPERYFRLGETMLRQLRADLVEADLAWRRNRANLLDRARDELARIDGEHKAKMTGIEAAIARLQAMREA
jgi:hypothetical protein